MLTTFVLLSFQIALTSFITAPPLAKLKFEVPLLPMVTLAVPKFPASCQTHQGCRWRWSGAGDWSCPYRSSCYC